MNTENAINPGNAWSPLFDGDGSTAEKAIIICTTPRTGSHFLCNILYRAQQGIPFEYFIESSFKLFRERFGPVSTNTFLEAYNRKLLSLRTLQGAFSFKLNPQQLKFVQWDIIQHLPKTFIWLRRKDLTEQTISFCAARQTGRWGADDKITTVFRSSKKPVGHHYEEAKNFLEQSDAQWQAFFNKLKVKPFTVWYEDITSTTRIEDTLKKLPFRIDCNALLNIVESSKKYTTNRDQKEDLRRALSEQEIM